MSKRLVLGLIALVSTPATAQGLPDVARPNTILISASGKSESAPDVATLDLTIRGEGRTPDAATTALAAKQRAVFGGLGSLDRNLDIRTGVIAMREVRGGECADRGIGDGGTDMVADALDNAAESLDQAASGALSSTAKGPCRVIGHVASTETSVSLAAVMQAGTAVGLARRLGVTSARVDSFAVRDDSAPAQRALADAMANARAQAAALAKASGLHLGQVVSIMRADPTARRLFDVQESLNLAQASIAQTPVVLDISPTPVETRVQLVVSFALLP